MSGSWQIIQEKPPSRKLMADQEERDFRVWLRQVERTAILPLKWAIWLTAAIFWMLSHRHGGPPPVSVFALFTAYFMFNLGATYFLVLNRVMLSQIRIMSIVSYYVDVLFVTLLIYLEAQLYPATDSTSTDFYIYYFLLVLRGFALFRTSWGNLLANMVIGGMFIWSVFWQNDDLLSYSSRNNLFRVVFIWLVILMSWFIVQVINRQKSELIRTREKLVQSENLALVGELAAGVAHEINNPIGIISTYSEFLQRNTPPEDERQKDFQVIRAEAQRCEAIVQELLTYARPSGHSLLPIDIAALNDEVLEFVSRRTQSGTAQPQIQKSYDTRIPHPVTDIAHLKQALLNIYLNAFQALENTEAPSIHVKTFHDTSAHQAVISITDNGPGISRSDLRRIFDPFFTTRARGTGLGLSITRRVLESCGGEVRVNSQPGHGTTVQLRLPLD